MGTSSVYGGPSNNDPKNNPLLPDDFVFGDEENEQDDVDQSIEQTQATNDNKEVSWKDAKTYMSKLASGKYKNTGKAISNHIKAYGGSKAASATAKAGINTVIRLGGFNSNSTSSTFKTVLEEYKIDFKDKSAKEVLNELTNLIAPVPITKDDSIARKALIVTLEYIYDLLDEENLDFESIDIISLNLMVPLYIKNYIYERIISDLGSRIEFYSSSPEKAFETEKELKEYITAKVDIAFKGKDFTQVNFNDNDTKKVIESLFNQCYTLMEE